MITASDVAKLRTITGSGMMDCKAALEATNGDFEAAIDFLRKKGQKVSAKRADKIASEGVVVALTTPDHKKGAVVEVNCETDFVAKNSDFVAFVTAITEAALKGEPTDTDGLKALKAGNLTVGDMLNDMLSKIGEKIEIARFRILKGNCVVAYNHLGNKIGVLVALNKDPNESIVNIGKDVAMQTAAMSPIAVNKESVPQSVIDKETEIAIEQVKAEGKPANMAEKIAQGKLAKFFKENTLLSQDFVKDSSKTVADVLKEVDKDLTVTDFARIAISA